MNEDRKVSAKEAAEMLKRNEITTVQYVQALENAIGKEKFWKAYNECLTDYFKNFSFEDKQIKEKIMENENNDQS